jgi:hypothetical protein
MLSFNINSKGRKMKFQIKKLLIIIMLNLFVFVATSSVYAQSGGYVKEGTYIGINLIENQMFGDFDNTTSYFGLDEILDVPYVDDGRGFSVVLGSRGPKGAFEFGYQRTRHDTISMLTLSEGEASYSVIDLNFKVDVFARDRTRPYVLFGFGFPWLTIEDGLIELDYDYYIDDYVISSFDDATYYGFALNAGAGVAYYIRPQLAVTGGLIYRWNWFTSAEGSSLDENLLERAFCFNIGLAYTF